MQNATRKLEAVEIAALQIRVGASLGYRSMLVKEANAVLNGYSLQEEMAEWLFDEAANIYRRILVHGDTENSIVAAEQIVRKINLGAHPFGIKGKYEQFSAIADRSILQELAACLKKLGKLLERL